MENMSAVSKVGKTDELRKDKNAKEMSDAAEQDVSNEPKEANVDGTAEKSEKMKQGEV